MHRTSLVSASDLDPFGTRKYENGDFEFGCKDTKIFWNMQILRHKKLSFLTKIAHILQMAQAL